MKITSFIRGNKDDFVAAFEWAVANLGVVIGICMVAFIVISGDVL